VSRSQFWFTVEATTTPKPDGLESAQTTWELLTDRPMAAETARNIALRAVEQQGYARARVFRGKHVGRLVAMYMAKEFKASLEAKHGS
jgi:hypothetical protein